MSDDETSTGVGNFLKTAFGSMRGNCHIESIDLKTREKVHEFFEWPIELTSVVEFVLDEMASGKEVYFSPALFRESGNHGKENILGSRMVWATFDPNPDFKSKLVPEPSIKIASGGDNCEHWYWLLNHPVMEVSEIERINQAITRTLGGNPTDWDPDRVLRIPGTVNRKYGEPREVRIIRQSLKEFDLSEFDNLQPYSSQVQVYKKDELIDLKYLMGRFAWPDELFDLLTSKESPGQSGYHEILRLALGCAKMGARDEVIFSALYFYNKRFGVFQGFEIPELEIAKILVKAREEFPFYEMEESPWSALENTSRLEGFTVKQFKEKNKAPAEYLFQGLLIRSGMMIVAGTSGVGKSQLTTQMGLRAANGEDFLMWKNGLGRPIKTVYLSLEMGESEIDLMWSDMGLYENPIRLSNEHFVVIPRGYEMHLNTPQGKMEYYELLQQYEPELIIIDSLSKAFNGSVSTDAVITEGMNLINRIRNSLGVSFIFLHHTNKPKKDGPGVLDKDIQTGSGQISANATSQINLARGDTPDFIQLAITKGRSFRNNPDEVIILERTEKLDFVVSDVERMKSAKAFEKQVEKVGAVLDIISGLKNTQSKQRETESDGLEEFDF